MGFCYVPWTCSDSGTTGTGAAAVKESGELQFSLTTGSGMRLYFKGNYVARGEVRARGFSSQDNFNGGSFRLLRGGPGTRMGYELMDDGAPVNLRLAGVDLTYLLGRDTRAQAGRHDRDEDETSRHTPSSARLGVNLLEEGRLKVEFQPDIHEDPWG